MQKKKISSPVYDYLLEFDKNKKNPITISLLFGMLGISYILKINTMINLGLRTVRI
jgi:hypothetical protein